MNATWNKTITLGVMLCITLGITLSVTILLVFGWKTEKKSTNTEFTVRAEATFKNATEEHLQEGSAPPNDATSSVEQAVSEEEKSPSRRNGESDPSTSVEGNWVSGKSTMRYSMNDNHGRIEISGFDVKRGQDLFCGSGRMTGRRLTVYNFYSFLDETQGTLKLDLSEDGKTFEGSFEGNDPTREARVVLVRLP